MREKYPRLWTLVVTIAIVLVVGVEITTSRGSIEDCEDLLDETESEEFISDDDHDTPQVNSPLLLALLVMTGTLSMTLLMLTVTLLRTLLVATKTLLRSTVMLGGTMYQL